MTSWWSGFTVLVSVPQISALDTVLSTWLQELLIMMIKYFECDQDLSVTVSAQTEASVPNRRTSGNSA